MLKSRFDNIVWSIPSLFGNDVFALTLLDIIQNHNFKIENYGSIICKWSSRLFSTLETDNIDFIDRTINNFYLRNVVSSLMFDKYNISWFDLNDSFCLSIIEKAREYNANIIISSDRLLKYVKKKFPDIKCIASPTNVIYKNFNNYEKEADYYNQLLDKYDRIILRPEFVKTEYLNKIKDLTRVEVIVNYSCLKYCPKIINHMKHIEKNNLQEFNCEKVFKADNNILPELYLSFDEIENLQNMGVQYFKILPEQFKDNKIILIQIINYLFKTDTELPVLYSKLIEQLDETDYFYKNQIIGNAKIKSQKN